MKSPLDQRCLAGLIVFWFVWIEARLLSADADRDGFVRVSTRDARYFELSDGRPYIPIGLNLIAPPGDDKIGVMEDWMRQLSENGGNFIRIWLGHAYFDVEHQRSGEYDTEKARRLDHLLEVARKYNIRVKLCLESFRHLGTQNQRWSSKPLHLVGNGGTATDIADFFDGLPSRDQFKRKLAWYARRYGSDPIIFGWELWNEINAVAGGDYMAWTECMLPELHRLFPRNLCMQSLGSFDTERVDPVYRRLCIMAGNDVAQVHRYLDLGAQIGSCKGPVDSLAAEAIRRGLSYQPQRPVILAESGAVEPRHSGPFLLYQKDREGMLLHDVLFAPFFAGAAGPGHIWHWDVYVAKLNLWDHFKRFAAVVKDIDPPAEKFDPVVLPHAQLRINVLKGKQHILIWCRDAQNDWKTELAQGQAPAKLKGVIFSLGSLKASVSNARARIYDPWLDRWSTQQIKLNQEIALPAFQRSLVVNIPLQ